MPLSTAAPGLTPEQWDDQFFMEYVRESRFRPYEGTDENSVIHVKENLTKARGDTLYFALVNRLSGAGVTGNTLLEGAEEALKSRECGLTIQTHRNAVAVTGHDEQLSAIDLRNAGKTALKLWAMELKRDQIVAALASINGVAFGSASAGQRNAWQADNSDRVLYGTKAKYSATHLTAINNIVAADKFSSAKLSLMKRIAQTATPKIRPIRTDGDREYFVAFVNSLSFRDLNEDTAMQNANRDARVRGISDNPIFQGGALMWDGCIAVEVPEMDSLIFTNGNGVPTPVGPVFLCGAQALGVAMAKRPKSTTDVRDYGFVQGVGVQMMHKIGKLEFDASAANDGSEKCDNGVVTGWFATAADA